MRQCVSQHGLRTSSETSVAKTGQGWHYYFCLPGGVVPNHVGGALAVGTIVAIHDANGSHEATGTHQSSPSHSIRPTPSPSSSSSPPSRQLSSSPSSEPSQQPSKSSTQNTQSSQGQTQVAPSQSAQTGKTTQASSMQTPINPRWQTATVTIMDNPVSLAIPQNVLVAKWNANNGVNWTQQKDAATPTAVMIYPDLGSVPAGGNNMVVGTVHSHNLEGGPGAYQTTLF